MLALVTGGSGSGKSEFAENLAVSYGSEKELSEKSIIYNFHSMIKRLL